MTLLRLPPEQAARFVWYEWSPDGRQVAVDLRDRVAVYSLQDGTYKAVPSPISAGLITGWLPDSSRLLLADYAIRKFILLDTRTWRAREIAYPASVEGDGLFSLSADGRTLAVSHGTATADVWLMRIPQ
jgi:hypothetical protein